MRMFYVITGSWESTYGPQTATLSGTVRTGHPGSQANVYEFACNKFQDEYTGGRPFSVSMYVVMPNEIG